MLARSGSCCTRTERYGAKPVEFRPVSARHPGVDKAAQCVDKRTHLWTCAPRPCFIEQRPLGSVTSPARAVLAVPSPSRPSPQLSPIKHTRAIGTPRLSAPRQQHLGTFIVHTTTAGTGVFRHLFGEGTEGPR